ncbi:hypothetical protein B0H14DRAFT_3539955 [Mycena olivaceomarginata]|nr:hypothetical protein B0H14DRAFT_3539955 [Mycena olivaceomarginata]
MLTRDPIRLPALLLSPHANAHSYSYPAPPLATPETFAVLTSRCGPIHLAFCALHTRRRLPRVTSTVRSRPDTGPGVHEHAHTADAARDAHTAGDGAERVIPARTCAHVADVGGKPRSSARGKRRRPVEGLFPFSLSSALSASATQTPCPIRVPLPPLVSVDGDAPEEDDEDAWEGEDEGEDEDGEMTVVDNRECGGDEELATPVPWRSDLLAPRTPPALSVNVHVGALPAYYKSEGEGEELQTPVSGLYSREAEREREGEGEREGEQVDGKRKR